MAIDIKESLTTKAGPLPLWGWGLAIGGGYLGYKFLTGGSKSTASTSTGTPATTTDSSLSGDTVGIIDQLQTDYAGLSGTVGNLSDANALLTQLNTARASLSAAMLAREADQRAIADAKVRYQDKKISKATYTAYVNKHNANIKANNAKITSLNALIASIVSKLAALGA